MYSLEGKLTFLAMERTASRAVRDAFIIAGAKQVADHHDGPDQGHEIVGVPFTVVRNHWDYIVSHWYNAKMNEKSNEPITNRWLCYHFMSNRYWYRPGSIFRFLEVPNIHVLRHETLQDDLDDLFMAHDLDPVKLEMEGESEERQGRHYRGFYNAASAGFVAWCFRPEIEKLGYRFEGPPGY